MADIVQSQNLSSGKITQDQLRELLILDPDEGIFRYRVNRVRAKAGSVAGSVHYKGWRSIMINQRRYQAHHWCGYMFMEDGPLMRLTISTESVTIIDCQISGRPTLSNR